MPSTLWNGGASSMGETVFRFGLDEISSVRARCTAKDCGCVLEMPLEQVGKLNGHELCPGCGAQWWTKSPAQGLARPNEPFSPLQESVSQILRLTGVRIEFVVAKSSVEAK